MQPGREGAVLAGKGILIAGAPAAAVVALGSAAAAQGAGVVACTEEPLVGGTNGVRAVVDDVSSEAGVERLLEATLGHVSALEVLICVFSSRELAPIAELDVDHWRAAVVAPLRSAFLLCRGTVEEFLSAGRPGRIVLVAGWPAAEPQLPGPNGESLDEVLQTALHSLARSIAKEYGRRGIACNLVIPVPVRANAVTAPVAAAVPDAPGAPTGSGPIDGILEAVWFLAGEESSFINGEALFVGEAARAGPAAAGVPPAR